MSQIPQDSQDEKPLDPELEKVRRSMMRLLAVSISIMFVGIMAVLIGVVYKVTMPDADTRAASGGAAVPSEAPVELVTALPRDFTVTSVSLDGNRLAFFGQMADGKLRVIVQDLLTSRIVSDVAVVNRP